MKEEGALHTTLQRTIDPRFLELGLAGRKKEVCNKRTILDTGVDIRSTSCKNLSLSSIFIWCRRRRWKEKAFADTAPLTNNMWHKNYPLMQMGEYNNYKKPYALCSTVFTHPLWKGVFSSMPSINEPWLNRGYKRKRKQRYIAYLS